MTPQERRSFAEIIVTNPLYAETMAELEASAFNRGVYAAATDNETRAAAMAEVRAIRAFRSNLEALLLDNGVTKGAPA